MFTSARLRLTLIYTVLILTITSSLSLFFYFQATNSFLRQHQRIQRRIQSDDFRLSNQIRRPMHSGMANIFLEDYLIARNEMARRLVLINLIIGGFVFLTGYILSGLTLKPIKLALDEQKRFVADAAHELKTPITAIKTAIEVNLLDKQIDIKSRILLKENLVDVIQLETLTNNLLTLATREKTLSQLNRISLIDVMEKAVVQVRPIAENKSQKIKVLTPDYNFVVKANKLELVKVLVEILDNAIKYSPTNSIIRVKTEKYRHNWVLIKVVDQGIGIEKKHHKKIFNRFYRIDESRTKGQQQGFGLGLAIAKKTVEKMGGSISLKNNKKNGTTFIIKLITA